MAWVTAGADAGRMSKTYERDEQAELIRKRCVNPT
jgi:hypothetical protein